MVITGGGPWSFEMITQCAWVFVSLELAHRRLVTVKMPEGLVFITT